MEICYPNTVVLGCKHQIVEIYFIHVHVLAEEDAAFEAAEAEHQQNREDPGRKVRHRGGAAAGKHRHKKGKS